MPQFDGLNLTWETLEGVVKHNGPLTGRKRAGRPCRSPLPRFGEQMDLELGTFAGPEAQVAAIADDIAYNNHDVDDGLRAAVFARALSERGAACGRDLRGGVTSISRHRAEPADPGGRCAG